METAVGANLVGNVVALEIRKGQNEWGSYRRLYQGKATSFVLLNGSHCHLASGHRLFWCKVERVHHESEHFRKVLVSIRCKAGEKDVLPDEDMNSTLSRLVAQMPQNGNGHPKGNGSKRPRGRHRGRKKYLPKQVNRR